MTTIADGGERFRALTEIASTQIVEAAAGTGKTSLLAGRVVMLLASGIDPRSIAAITFTELAAGELRQRIADYLECLIDGRVPEELRICLPNGPSAAQGTALRAAAVQFDQLVCSTIHGFCRDLLATYSVEAGIDPGAEILDADQADFAFDSIFDQWWRNRLDGTCPDDDPIASVARRDPRGAEALLRNFAKFRRRYRTARPLQPDLDPNADLDFTESVREFRRWCDHVGAPREADPEVAALETMVSHFERRFDPLPGFERLWGLAHPPPLPIMRKDSFDLREYRRRSMWRKAMGREAGDRLADQAEEHYARCRAAYSALMGRIATALISTFSAELDGVLADYEAFKKRAAVLDFDDLLFTCRDVLRAYPGVRQAAAGRFVRILVDEFQDTDPVQAEVLFLLCGSGDDTEVWHRRRLNPGQLFLVGDPKQAIYRFRGADLATYLTVRRAVEEQFPDSILRVTSNFRSRGQILEHVNRCFQERLSAQEAGYVALRSTRREAEHGFPCVAKVSIQLPPETRVDSSRDEEASVVAEVCARLIGNLELKLNNGDTRRLTPGDIALLAPVSTDLWRYERALEEAGLPFASQAGKNLFRRQEAQDFVALVRTLADPHDTLALGALLRGPLVGLTEQELLDITHSLPSLDEEERLARLSLRTDPALVKNEVAREVLTVLRDLRRRVHRTTPALLLTEAVERLRARAIVTARSADQAVRSLANIDGLLERARSYGVRGLAQFAADIDDEWSNESGHPEGMVEADGNSIEIVTVHSSKGLEWPVVIPINRASMPRRAETFVYRRKDESLHWALGQVVPPTLEDALRAENVEKQNENLRLLYVACTRAMEMLIVPEFSWSNDASWAKLMDLKLGDVPELNLGRMPRTKVVPPSSTENRQTAEVFAAEQSSVEQASQPIRWIRPSDGDPDVIPLQISNSFGEEPLQPSVSIEGGRTRGVLLHKLMEELVSGELDEAIEAIASRARTLAEQLATQGSFGNPLDADELAETALQTIRLPEIEPFRKTLTAEVPIYGSAPASANRLIGGRADAVAQTTDGGRIVFDWKSDIAPKEADRSAYREQLGQYLHVLGAQRGAIVYMTLGRVDWISASRS
ncbi:UvrD-helicase domain-containing protein [Bradyrhizobium sp. 155]|uniref:UvrD-helicase domain-containing protein n=1 Tax=unclassified Bradyrhizobium TaxID=2631580 RepID=UPI001FF9BF79|nr:MULTISPECIES: UvrD-helicase domain-containing protein [unclassified Bradyrhizobium]MCK1704906.1 UvrD-helicase domain-containing protein [Bradyrhizobium sp. 146]UPK11220.1 UvrD-helicase domain-containing protein [Bradyrhizobium sp. 155]